MFDYIKGTVTENTPTYIVVEANGLGYGVNISLNTYEELQRQSGEVKILLHEVIREDSWTFYGFMTSRERELFRLLIGVSGVGPNTAIIILSSLTPSDLETVIASEDHSRLKSVKGIGLKTAQRIIVDLKDKIKSVENTLSLQSGAISRGSETYEEALAALTALGFPRPQSQKVLRRVFDADPGIKVEAAIKQALGMM